jgi:hypothetical protein
MLTGVLYFHRISDLEMTGVSRKNWVMLRKLCGERAFKNVVIVTNMWDDVDLRTGNEREAELMRDDTFFKPALYNGATMTRHDNTLPSAQTIVRLLTKNSPLPLRIQEEFINQCKVLSNTDAGEELNREFTAVIRKYEVDLQEIRTYMQQTMREDDEVTRKELEFEIRGMTTEIGRYQNEIDKLGPK